MPAPIDLITDPAALRHALSRVRALSRLELAVQVNGGTPARAPLRLSPGGALLECAITLPAVDVDGLDPETVIWRDRAIAAGGTFTDDSITWADELIIALKATDYGGKVVWLLPLLGDNLATARVPLRDTLGVGIATNTAFVDADFSEATGLQGNGSTKYLDSLIVPASIGSGNNGGLGWWETNFTGAGNVEPMGSYKQNNAPDCRFVLDIRPARGAFFWGEPTTAIGDATAGSNAHYYGQRSSATDRRIYKDGVLKATATGSDLATGSSDNNILICGADGGNVGITSWPGRCAVAYLTDGTLTDAEVTALHTLLDTYLITPTGR